VHIFTLYLLILQPMKMELTMEEHHRTSKLPSK